MKCAPNYIYFTRDPKSSRPNHNLKAIQKFGEKESNFHHATMAKLVFQVLALISSLSSHLIPNLRVSPPYWSLAKVSLETNPSFYK